MATRKNRNEPYYITCLRNIQKEYPEYLWSTEQRMLNDGWVRTISGRRGHFIMAVEVPDRPMVVNDQEDKNRPKAFWRAAADLIVRRINEGELKYGQMPTMDSQKVTGQTDILLRSEDAGGDDSGREVGKDSSSRTDRDGSSGKVRG